MPSIHEVPARQGRAVKVGRGQALQIINPFGTQVVDFWAFDARDLGTHLSMEHTRASLSRLTPRAGDVLVDNWREPMLAFEADTSPGVHDTVIAPCDRARYVKLGCAADHASCADNLHRALEMLNPSVPVGPASFNLWMNMPVLPTGDLEWRGNLSEAPRRRGLCPLPLLRLVVAALPPDALPHLT